MPNPRVYLDIAIAGKPAGRIIIELFSDVVPRTAENFRCLCTGERGIGRCGKPLHFRGVPFHSVIPGYACESGDIVAGNGSGGESIWGTNFADESFDGVAGRHVPGSVSMASKGPNRNNSCFSICTVDTAWLDGRQVVFGKVVESAMPVLLAIEAVGSRGGTPTASVVIVDCGMA